MHLKLDVLDMNFWLFTRVEKQHTWSTKCFNKSAQNRTQYEQ